MLDPVAPYSPPTTFSIEQLYDLQRWSLRGPCGLKARFALDGEELQEVAEFHRGDWRHVAYFVTVRVDGWAEVCVGDGGGGSDAPVLLANVNAALAWIEMREADCRH